MTAPRPPLGPVRQPAWEIEPDQPQRGLPATVIARGADTSSTSGASVNPPRFDALDRTGLTGHTIGVEPLTRAMCVRSGLPVETAGELAAVERTNGEFVKVWEIEHELTDSTIEAAARSIARSHRATFVGGAR